VAQVVLEVLERMEKRRAVRLLGVRTEFAPSPDLGKAPG
jgi:hypothetical protein